MNTLQDLSKSKPHYEILDGLRGIAAIMVVLFHIVEIHSGGDHTKQWINHGYLAVDFFFILSGYVIGYAYDDRWNNMTLGHFFKRRIIRLQPMLVVGSIIGALLFYFQNSPALGWGGISEVPLSKVLMVMFLGFFLIPVGKDLDIRGWNEMFPLNGAAWTLFFEEIANISYALVLRHLSAFVLGIFAAIAAGFTVHYALTNPAGDIIGGWAIDDPQLLKIGFIRVAFPFLAGLLLARTLKLKYIKNAFLYTGLLLILILSIPRIGGHEQPWQNGLYECFCLIVIFPFIVWLGAGGKVEGKTKQVSKFLGDISYPIYITHYPVMYVYYSWVVNNGYSFREAWPAGLQTAVVSLALAYGLMKLYDIPLRTWLRNRFLSAKNKVTLYKSI
jgi:peptidoglycan/LPS O-acetylase OafA/YrhL